MRYIVERRKPFDYYTKTHDPTVKNGLFRTNGVQVDAYGFEAKNDESALALAKTKAPWLFVKLPGCTTHIRRVKS